MSSNIFRIFAIFILAMMVYFVLNRISVSEQPVKKASGLFMQGLTDGSKSAVLPYIDPEVVTIVAAGDKITNMTFKELNFFDSAFSKRPEVRYSFLELSKMRINVDVSPVTLKEDKIATVPLIGGGRLYLREKDQKWLVFYISNADQEKTQ